MNGAGADRSYRVLRHRDFRLIWSAELLSLIGSQIQRVAVAWQIYDLTGDPFKLGLLGLARFFPVILFGIAGGVIADRGDRRRTLILSQSALLILSALLAFWSAAGLETLWPIYGLVILSATVEGVSNPTRQALIPLLVPKADFPAASTMGILAFQIAMVTGPAIGGVLIAVSGVSAAYAIDAVSFAVVIGAVLAMRFKPPPITLNMGGFAAARQGFQFLRQTPILLSVMAADFVATFFGASTTLMPVFAADILKVGPSGLGLLLSAPAAGAVIIVSILSVVRLPDQAGKIFLISVAAYGAFLLGFGLSKSFVLSLLFLAGSGAADAISTTLRQATRNLLTPDELRGRVSAVHRTMAVGGPQLGEFEAGIAATLVGAGPSVAFGGSATMIAAILIGKFAPGVYAYRFSTSPTPVVPDDQQKESSAVS